MRRDVPAVRLALATVPVLLIVAFLWLRSAFALPDRAWVGFLMAQRRATAQDPRVVLVYVTDDTRRRLGLPPSIPRGKLAAYLAKVAALGARAQLVDTFVAPNGDEAGNALLASTARDLPDLVFDGLQTKDRDHALHFQAPLSGALGPVAQTTCEEDALGQVERVSLCVSYPEAGEVPHLALAGVRLAHPELRPTLLDRVPGRPWYLPDGGGLQIGDRILPTFTAYHQVFLDYAREPDDRPRFETWTFEEVMTFAHEGRPFQDRVVILGSREETQHDRWFTPVGPQWGPSIVAQVYAALLDGHLLLPLGARAVLGLCVLAWAGGLALYGRLSPLHAALGAVGSTCALLAVSAVAYRAGALWLPVTAPIACNLGTYAVIALLRARQAENDRRFIRDTFSRYAPRQIVDHLMADASRLRLGGDAQEVSVLFADINGFTSITEQQGPQETIDMLNQYFARMTAVIFRHEGLIKQFVGDEIMVIFGAPLYCEDHAERALRTAWEMREEAARLRTEREAAGKPGFDVKFGLNSGVVVLGNIGAPERMEYGAVGDVVNAASRIMNLNKEISTTTRILVGERTAALGGARFALREAGTYTVKGKAEAVRVLELTGEATAPSPAAAGPPGHRP